MILRNATQSPKKNEAQNKLKTKGQERQFFKNEAQK